ncbi:protein kinase domain-containing protein [Ditylenchus destructor]|nr:protein kinase domain-containing protein [Ditylenchus destructor]
MNVQKIADFGLSKVASDVKAYHGRCGTKMYMAPEVARRHAYGKEADIYSLGAVIYYLGTGIGGKDEWERAQVQEIVNYHLDAAALRKDVFLPAAARIFPQYIKQLKESKSGFLAPSGLTYVDFIVADYLEYWVSKMEPQFMKENYPEIGAYVNKVYSVPQIKDYIKNRKD